MKIRSYDELYRLLSHPGSTMVWYRMSDGTVLRVSLTYIPIATDLLHHKGDVVDMKEEAKREMLKNYGITWALTRKELL